MIQQPKGLHSDRGPNDRLFSNNLNVSGETIVKLRDGVEPPLIVIHGGLGSIHAFGPLKKAFSTTLWAIQVTRDTPRQSLEGQIEFYYKEIVKHQASGPYRICSFSASSIIAVGIVKHLENDRCGRIVEQLAFIDHFPTTFIMPQIGVDITRVSLTDSQHMRESFLNGSIKNLLAMTRADLRGTDPRRKKMADELQAAYQLNETSAAMKEYKEEVDVFLNNVFDFIVRLHDEYSSKDNKLRRGTEFMENWMSSVNAPVSVYLATYGMLGTYTPAYYPPPCWGIHRSFRNVKVTILDAGHYDILGNSELHDGLQELYLQNRTARL